MKATCHLVGECLSYKFKSDKLALQTASYNPIRQHPRSRRPLVSICWLASSYQTRCTSRVPRRTACGDASPRKGVLSLCGPAPPGEAVGGARRRHVLHGNDARRKDGARVGCRRGLPGLSPAPEPLALELFSMGPRRFTAAGRFPGKRHIHACLLGQLSSLPAPRPL